MTSEIVAMTAVVEAARAETSDAAREKRAARAESRPIADPSREIPDRTRRTARPVRETTTASPNPERNRGQETDLDLGTDKKAPQEGKLAKNLTKN